MSLLFEAKRIGNEVMIVAPRENVSAALQNVADEVITLPLLQDSQL